LKSGLAIRNGRKKVGGGCLADVSLEMLLERGSSGGHYGFSRMLLQLKQAFAALIER